MIHLYDLQGASPVLTRRITFPATGKQVVNDCVFGPGDATLFAITSDGTNSTFGNLQYRAVLPSII